MTATYVHDMSKIDAIEQNIGEAQTKINKLKNNIEVLVRELVEGSARLEETKFWAMVTKLATEFEQANKQTLLACDRFLWKYIHGPRPDPYLAMRFVRTYKTKVSELYQPLFKVIDGCGDDGYGDILDSFPLFGESRFKAALRGEITGTSEEQYQGENYIQMRLEEALLERYAQYCAFKSTE